MSTQDNMPAYPLTEDQIDRLERGNAYEGVTKREYFAGLALQSIIAAKHEEIKWWSDDCKQQSFAQSAVAYAETLLEELEKDK